MLTTSLRAKAIKLLIKVLVRELDLPPGGERDPRSDDFLAGAWMSPGFRTYIAHRDAKIVHQLAGGEGMEGEPRDAYTRHTGQRVENLFIAHRAKMAWQRKEKEKAEKLSTPPEK